MEPNHINGEFALYIQGIQDCFHFMMRKYRPPNDGIARYLLHIYKKMLEIRSIKYPEDSVKLLLNLINFIEY